MLQKVGPIIDRWYFTDLPTPRAESAQGLVEKWRASESRRDVQADTYASPMEAFNAAREAANPADRIVVFGSFYTVGGVLKDGVPRLGAKHV